MSSRTSPSPPRAPVPRGLRVIESLAILVLTLMAFLLAIK